MSVGYQQVGTEIKINKSWFGFGIHLPRFVGELSVLYSLSIFCQYMKLLLFSPSSVCLFLGYFVSRITQKRTNLGDF